MTNNNLPRFSVLRKGAELLTQMTSWLPLGRVISCQHHGCKPSNSLGGGHCNVICVTAPSLS